MFSKPLVFGLVALGSVTAAAGGAYIAARHNAAQVRPAATQASTGPQASAPVTGDGSVHETEAPVTPATTPQPPASEPAVRVDRAAVTPEHAPGTAKSPTANRHASAEPRAETKRPVQVRTPSGKPAGPTSANQPSRTASLPAPSPNVPSHPASQNDGAVAPVQPVAPPPAPEGSRADAVDAPRAPQLQELVLPTASVIGLQLETPLTSERARIEDRVEARVTRDVLVDGRLAIPAGSRVLGSVTQVDRGGKVKDRARLAIRFHTLVLGDGSEVSLRTEPITREGEAPAADSSKKIGGAAVGGAILGAILGGGKGAMIGGMAGAGGGTAMVMAGDRNPATFQPGTVVTARLSAPATIQVRKEQ